jgi:hypothetical protein
VKENQVFDIQERMNTKQATSLSAPYEPSGRYPIPSVGNFLGQPLQMPVEVMLIVEVKKRVPE